MSAHEHKDKLQKDCYDALTCLYIAVDEDIARDVNVKVRAYIEFLREAGLKLAADLTKLEVVHEVRCPHCGHYYGGHATGGDDICCCHS